MSRSAVRAALNLGEPAPCCRPAEGLSLDSDEIEWARATSNECALGFIQTEYFAGIGDQAGIVWDAGTVVLGPLYGTNDEHDPPEGDVVLTSAPINEILRWLGAKGTGSVDEFDALGLGEFRSMT